ncbi:helix-turn-helix domain-containing protein [Candidatus Micrarchaeota archaeon]|nr:helix-turn-helix domain-containing protein [Candidatus Micrarchaeota archaeon]
MEEEKKKRGPPVLFELDINHLCWFCDITDRNPDATIVSTMSQVHGDSITNVIQLTSPDPKKDIERMRAHQLVKRVEVLTMSANSALLVVTSKYAAMTYKILHQTKVELLESPVTKSGVDSEILMAPSHKEMSDLITRMSEHKDYADVKLKKKRYLDAKDAISLSVFRTSGFFDLQSAKHLIAPKQAETFQKALDYGYYDIPKKISIEELAEKLGLSPSTVAEHLRKAEAKLLPIFWKVLKKL